MFWIGRRAFGISGYIWVDFEINRIFAKLFSLNKEK